MLTPTDWGWLRTQRDLLMSATAKADIYGHALAVTYARPGRLWRPFKLWETHRERVHMTRLRDVWAADAARRAVVIDAWIAVYNITTGEYRGPVPPADTRTAYNKKIM